MQIIDFLENNIDDVKDIIGKFELYTAFSSHDFIKKFTERFESQYINMLAKYKNSGKAFQTVHSLIGQFLSSKSDILRITKTEKRESENIKGNLDVVQFWVRIS
jgi:hypothetical protein